MVKKQVIRKNALVPTALISGGAGFIGSHLAEFLLEKKARVIVLDNFKTGKKVHVKHLLKDKNFALYDVDINKDLPEEIESVDYIFHLAGLEEYLFGKDEINLDSLLTNSLGTKNLLDLAKKSNAKFLLASTIDVYQGWISQLYLEKYFGKTQVEENKFSLIEAKRFAEAIVWEYFNSYNIDSRIVRLPEVYGPRMSLESAGSLGRFLKSVVDGRSLVIYGDGTEKEYYLHVSDIVSGLVKSLFNEKTKGNIYSLVPKEPLSVLEIAYFIKSLADGELAVEFKPEQVTSPPAFRAPDTFNLKGLNWKSRVEFKQGVVDTLDSFGYEVNRHSFKPTKILEKKAKEVYLPPKEKLVSLQGILPEPKVRKRKVEKPLYRLVKSSTQKPRRKLDSFQNLGQAFKSFHLGLKADVGYGLAVVAVVIAAGLVFVGIPGFSLYFNSKRAVLGLEKLSEATTNLDLEEIENQTLSAYKGFSKAQNSLHRLSWVFKIVGKRNEYSSYDKLLGSLSNFSKAAHTLSSAVGPLGSLWEVLRPDTDHVLNVETFSQTQLAITSAKNFLKLAEADLLAVNESILLDSFENKVLLYESYLYKFQEGLEVASVVFSDLPNILGASEEKKYILWFQNSNEIRPTGGFIGSYGVLTLENGKLKNLVIDDIYNPDGQIDVRDIVVAPPEPISTFLTENRLYLRNSNWDPDFTRSVSSFDDLYFRVTGDEIDGYIALDLKFVEGLLNVTGPVFLAAYNEEISAENLDERAQFYSSFDYQEGSSDKRSFLTVLGSKLLERLFSLERQELGPLFGGINKALLERHFMIVFANSPVNSILKNKMWDGSLVETSGDFLSVVNANLGGTKANYHVKNKLTYEVSSLTRDGLLRASLYLDYIHTADETAWPSGPYTDYVRILSQVGSKLTGAKIIPESGEEKDIFQEIITSKVGNYNSFETNFTLEPGESVRLVFSYDLPEGLSFTKDEKRYDLYWQKQPGTHSDEFFFVLNPPFGTTAQSLSSDLNEEGETIKASGLLDEDKSFFLLLR